MKRTWLFAPLAALSLAIGGCGHTDEEMAAKQREIDKLSAELKTAKQQIAEDQAKYADARNQLDKMREDLKAAGIGLEKSQADAQRLAQALAEYKQRAEQLAVIEGRFRELRKKLDKLNSIGLKVAVRNNRMVIQLPGDILFDSGKDALRPQGTEVLAQVAEVIRNDQDLSSRFFLVAGHTDNAPYPRGGPFKDNWGLSLARARQVLLFLIDDAKAGKDGKAKGGGLSPIRWAAAGYGEQDPSAGTIATQSKDEMQKNRRVELVVQPNVEEMLNLNNIH